MEIILIKANRILKLKRLCKIILYFCKWFWSVSLAISCVDRLIDFGLILFNKKQCLSKITYV